MSTSQAPQVAAAKKAALKTSTKLPAKAIEANTKSVLESGLRSDTGQDQHNRERVYAPRAPPSPPVRLLGKPEVLRVASVTFPTVWKWMRTGQFPRARIVGGKSMWLSTEVDAWLAQLPTRALKGDKGLA
jgi:predicted DNA-binding transcriptional regulator AlpA